jgi:hypothetical protein
MKHLRKLNKKKKSIKEIIKEEILNNLTISVSTEGRYEDESFYVSVSVYLDYDGEPICDGYDSVSV